MAPASKVKQAAFLPVAVQFSKCQMVMLISSLYQDIRRISREKKKYIYIVAAERSIPSSLELALKISNL